MQCRIFKRLLLGVFRRQIEGETGTSKVKIRKRNGATEETCGNPALIFISVECWPSSFILNCVVDGVGNMNTTYLFCVVYDGFFDKLISLKKVARKS